MSQPNPSRRPPRDDGDDTAERARRLLPALAALAVVAGCAIRASYTLAAGFPLNDGGLFYAMTEDLQRNHYRLPAFTSYNHLSIPFSYPPLGFYLTGALADVTHLNLVDAYRFVPLVATCLTLPAFFLLARRLLTDPIAVAAATFAFAFLPRTFIWMLMGGGVTRSLGLLFALLALHQLHSAFTERRKLNVAGAGVFAALTALSHLETAWFLGLSAGLFFLAFGRSRFGVTASLSAASMAVLVSAPWWGTVLQQHGSEPFVASFRTGGSIFSDAATRAAVMDSLARITSTSEPYFPLVGALGVVGGLVWLARGRWLLPAWWLAILLLDARASSTFTMLPLGLLAGGAVAEVLLPALSGALGGGFADRRPTLPAAVALALITAYAGFSAVVRTPGAAGEAAFLAPLSAEERQALQWVSKETPPDSRFLVVPDSSWETAKTMEWFPELADRVSVATVQGTEWLPDGRFDEAVQAYYEAFDCGYTTDSCLDQWQLRWGLSFTHVYIRKWDSGAGQCCGTLVDSLRMDPRYRLVYDGAGATIFYLQPQLPAALTPGQ
jgi:hypothetical protein